MLQGQEQEQEQEQGRDRGQRPSAAGFETTGGTENAAVTPVVHVIGDPALFGDLVQTLVARGLRLADALQDVESALRQGATAHAIVVYPNPVMALGEKMQAGEALGDAIAAWRGATERLLSQFRRDRRRITLLDGHAAGRAPESLQRLLGDRLSRTLEIPAITVSSATGNPPAGLPQLVAAQALRQDEASAALLAELEASSLPLGPAYRIDVDAIVADGLAGANTAEFDELREENELLLLQLHQVQEELEAHFLENRKLKGRDDEFRANADRARADAEQARAEAGKARLARESLQTEFNEARAAWTAERKALTDKLQWTADDLAAVRRSLSWRLTAPLRRVLGLIVGDSKL